MTSTYTDQGALDCTVEADRTRVKGKTAIITGGTYENDSAFGHKLGLSRLAHYHHFGVLIRLLTLILSSSTSPGANGIGAVYARALADAGYARSMPSGMGATLAESSQSNCHLAVTSVRYRWLTGPVAEHMS